MRIGGGSERSFGIVAPTRGERSLNASEPLPTPLNLAAEQPTFADPVGAARPNRPWNTDEAPAVPRGTVHRTAERRGQAAFDRDFRFPRGT
jgi:hypothetical protein